MFRSLGRNLPLEMEIMLMRRLTELKHSNGLGLVLSGSRVESMPFLPSQRTCPHLSVQEPDAPGRHPAHPGRLRLGSGTQGPYRCYLRGLTPLAQETQSFLSGPVGWRWSLNWVYFQTYKHIPKKLMLKL